MKKHLLCLKPGIYATEILNLIAVSAELAVAKNKKTIISLENKKASIIVVDSIFCTDGLFCIPFLGVMLTLHCTSES